MVGRISGWFGLHPYLEHFGGLVYRMGSHCVPVHCHRCVSSSIRFLAVRANISISIKIRLHKCRRISTQMGKGSGLFGYGSFPSVRFGFFLVSCTISHGSLLSIIVIGWLQVSPKCDFDRVSSALDKANKIAYIATSDPDTPLLVLNQTEERAFMLESYRPGSVHRDEESSAPVFNYARFFPWVHAVEQVAEAYHMASENALVHRPVNGSREWVVGAPAEVKKANRRGILEDVERYCRVGPDGRSPRQYDAEDGMIECYTPPGTPQFPVPMIEILPVSMESIRSNSSIQPGHKRVAPAAKTSPWGREVWTRVIMASLLALFLQWGTAGASIMVVVSPCLTVHASAMIKLLIAKLHQWFTPTIGLGTPFEYSPSALLSLTSVALPLPGCRSGAYILYALASTVIWAIMLLSSILAHYAHLPRPHSHHLQLRYVVNTAAARLSVALRRLGKLLAILNALWIVVTCLFQFSSFFDRCWCDSSVLGLGPRKAYDVLVLTDADIKPMTAAWIGGKNTVLR